MGVDPTTDTTYSVRTNSWTCSYTPRVKQPVADQIVRTSFRSLPTRMFIISPRKSSIKLFSIVYCNNNYNVIQY